MKDLDGFIIAIAGLGLMGGSLAMALTKHGIGRRRLGSDLDPLALRRALELGVIDGVVENDSQVDMFVLAMPVRGIVAWLQTAGTSLPASCVVLDLGSTKQEVVSAMGSLSASCVGGHPMCGKETSGIAAADPELFRDAKFVLTPVPGSSAGAMEAALSLVHRLGAQPIVMDAAEHDRAVAAISHMPYLLSVALVNSVEDLQDEYARILAATGFSSMTRLAASDTRMMGDIIATNKASIIDLLDLYEQELRDLRQALAGTDESAWRARLERAYRVKRSL